ncbi:PREDICTED: uncharacterized protein LOC106902767 [Calidris pugnax]|uniref:uncharacterized protein LOC106902767 n=1 Tax=Calidris pugnax TaxID=198806 RepID=UPI00071C4035|nr:PREDICTED: uncharacterized protein LOC106902767 [Calidris pugnax]
MSDDVPRVLVSPCLMVSPRPRMPFGAVLEQVGGLGRFQVLQTALLAVPILLMASHNLLQNFTAAVPPHRCHVPSVTPGPGTTPGVPSATPGPPGTTPDGTSAASDGTSVASDGTSRSSSAILRSPDGTLGSPGATLRSPDGNLGSPGGTYIPGATHVTLDGLPGPPDGTHIQPDATLGSSNGTLGPPDATLGWSNGTLGPPDATLGSCRRYVASSLANSSTGPWPTEPCHDGWDYDRSIYVATIVTEWDLVCSYRQLRQMAQSIYMAGVLVGALVLGGLSDRFGRKAMLMWSYLQLGVMGTCTAFAPNYASYCVFRFAGGMALSGFGLSIACLVVEWIPTPYRAITVAITGFAYTLGQILLAGVAYAVPHWRWLQLTVSLPFFVFLLYSWWLAESARWLVLSGRAERAVKVLQRVARINKRKEEGEKITVEILKSNMKEELAGLKASYTISDLVRTPVIRHIFFCLSIVWFSISFSYYGLAMDLQNFGVSIYLIQVIFGAVDFPAKVVVTISVSYIGRRVSLMVALFLAGLVIIANIFVSAGGCDGAMGVFCTALSSHPCPHQSITQLCFGLHPSLPSPFHLPHHPCSHLSIHPAHQPTPHSPTWCPQGGGGGVPMSDDVPRVLVSPCLMVSPRPRMPFGAVLEQVGGLGRFQVLQTALLAVPILLMASHNLLQNFTAAVPPHRCHVPSVTPGPGTTPGVPSATPGPPGTTPDGTSAASDGTSVASDGTSRSSSAILRSPDGTLGSPGATLRSPDGNLGSPGGTYIPGATHVTLDGLPGPPDGTHIQPDATLGSSNGTLGPPDATLGWSNGTLGPPDATLGSCRRYVASSLANSSTGPWPTEPCHDGWDYDRSIYVATIVTEWDLVCSYRQLRQMAQSIYMAGVLVGALVLGGLSDRFGRKAMLMWSYLQLGVMGTCTAFAPNYASYCVFRFAGGMALSGFGLSIACLVVEWIPTPYRAITVAITGFAYTLGQILLAGVAYAVPHWRWLQLTVSLPFFVFLLYSWWLAESARWLVLSGRAERAVKVLQRVARINKRKEEGEKITVEILKSNMKEELAGLKASYTISDLVRTPVIRHIFFCLSIVWFSISFSYYGLAMDLQNFGVSIYLIQVIFGAVDFPAKVVVTISVSYIGRRVSLMVALFLAGLVIIANIFVSAGGCDGAMGVFCTALSSHPCPHQSITQLCFGLHPSLPSPFHLPHHPCSHLSIHPAHQPTPHSPTVWLRSEGTSGGHLAQPSCLSRAT